MWGTEKTSTIVVITKTGRTQATMQKANRRLHETRRETRKSALQVIEITVHEGQVKTARTNLNKQEIEHYFK